jgi:hypothetical protein
LSADEFLVYVELLGLWPDNEEKGLGSERSGVRVSMLGKIKQNHQSIIFKVDRNTC